VGVRADARLRQKPATIDEIAKHDHVLTPGRYVGAEEREEDKPFAEKYLRLVAELEERLAEGERLAAVIREQSGRIGSPQRNKKRVMP
jgi:type I restriction enzyme M protein